MNRTRYGATLASLKFLSPVILIIIAAAVWSATMRPGKGLRRSPEGNAPASIITPTANPVLRQYRIVTDKITEPLAHDIALVNGALLVLHSRNRVTVVDTKTGEVSDRSEFLRQNAAMHPFTEMWSSGVEGTVFFGDANVSDVLEVRVAGDAGHALTLNRKLARPLHSSYSIPVYGGAWLSNGYFRESALLSMGTLVQTTITQARNVGTSLFPEVEEPLVYSALNRNVIAASPDGRYLAQAFQYRAQLNIYTSAGALERALAGPVAVTPQYKIYVSDIDGREHLGTLPDTTFCYTDLTSSEGGPLALFSGMSAKSGAVSGTQLHSFAWDGRLLGTWQLDQPALKVEVTGDGRRAFVFRGGEHGELAEYSLPSSAATRTVATRN